MIGLIADVTPEPVRWYVARHGLTGSNGISAHLRPQPVRGGLRRLVPIVVFLIGPDGRISSPGTSRAKLIEQAVARALQRHPQPQAEAEPPRADRVLKLEVVVTAPIVAPRGAAVLVLVTRGQAHT